MNALFKRQDKEAMEILGVISNSVIGNMSNKYSSSFDTWGKMGRLQNLFLNIIH